MFDDVLVEPENGRSDETPAVGTISCAGIALLVSNSTYSPCSGPPGTRTETSCRGQSTETHRGDLLRGSDRLTSTCWSDS